MEVVGVNLEKHFVHEGRQKAQGKLRKAVGGGDSDTETGGSSSAADVEDGGGEKYFRCNTCSYVTNVKARYTKHVKYHTMPLIKCDFCDFKTPYKWNLDRHYKNHNGEGDLHCPLCNFTADIKQSLTVHLQNHHSSYPGHKTLTAIASALKMNGSGVGNGTSSNGTAAATSTNLVDSAQPFDLSKDNRRQSVSSPSPALIERALGGLLKQNGSGLDLSTKSESSSSLLKTLENPRKRSLARDEESGGGYQKSVFFQSLALQPREGMDGAEGQRQGGSARNSTSVQSTSPERRSSTGSTDTKGKKKERKLGLEEISQKLVANKSEEIGFSLLKNSLVITSNSTRCQFCRQRCKTSADLALHLAVCTEAATGEGEEDSGDDKGINDDDYGSKFGGGALVKATGDSANDRQGDDHGRGKDGKIFVWNNLAGDGNEREDEDEEDMEDAEEAEDDKGQLVMDVSGGSDDLVGFETAPGIGAIHVGKLEEAEYEGYRGSYLEEQGEDEEDCSVTKTRKVFRCPQQNCGFWATTASRFHVHIVGHYNLKPFECSQCSYKSNWRWDITKHIKLKAMRDPSHSKAKVLLTHESGNRNYRKYDRYLVMMQLKYSADSKLPDCSTVASKRTDVAMELSPSRDLTIASPKISPQPKGTSLPKLTRAPYASRASSPTESVKSDESSSRQRPPPALVPINGHGSSKHNSNSTMIVQKRMLSGGHVSLPETEIDLSAYGTTFSPVTMNLSRDADNEAMNSGYRQKEVKKQLWKCKKCPFKHASKEAVVHHIRELHKPKRGESVSILSQNHLTSVMQDDEEAAHRESKGAANCNFSCTSCSVTVQTKRELIEHAQRHIWEARLNQVEGKPHLPDTLTITAEETPPRPRSGAAGSHKKYHCKDCPYVTDSKGQFLYHKQFHRPRDSAFKCSQCSYTVSHKHLLHQHLRVHGIHASSASASPPGALAMDNDNSSVYSDDQPLNLHASVDLSESASEARPTVLVWRDERPLRMYRCQQCPQVYAKLSDLIDHEYTHGGPTVNVSHNPLQPQQNISISPCGSNDSITNGGPVQGKVLYCCDSCPARFFYEKELEIHSTFHQVKSEYQCDLCSYSAKQKTPHLMSHMKVHGVEYQEKTAQILQRYPRAPKLRGKSSGSSATAAKVMPSPLIIPQPKISLLTATNLSMKSNAGAAMTIETSLVCKKCPAKFQSLQSYQQHVTFHGRSSMFKCRHCDYSVDSLKNLTLHELLHASNDTADGVENITVQPRLPIPHRNSTPAGLDVAVLEDDKIDEDAFIGNPEFTYPTYIKNGRVKSKRYKCSKCPSAFEKRDQYKVHMGLHGSDQRYKCPVCDYAVTYYANFIQHLKKHKTQPEVPPELLVAKPLSKIKQEEQAASRPAAIKSSASIDRPLSLPKDIVVSKKAAFSWKCDLCPFSTDETKARDEHRKRHIRQAVKGSESSHTCSFCDYTVPTKALLREHVRLHFKVPVESLQSYLFANDVDIYVNGNYEEKIYSEKENYEDQQDGDAEEEDEEEDDDDRSYASSGHENDTDNNKNHKSNTRPVTFVDMAARLPITMLEEASDEEVVINGRTSPPLEPMDCSS